MNAIPKSHIHNYIVVLCTGYLEYTRIGVHDIFRRSVSYNYVVWC